MEKKWHYAGNSRGSHHRKATFRPEVRRVGKVLDTIPGTTKRLLPPWNKLRYIPPQHAFSAF